MRSRTSSPREADEPNAAAGRADAQCRSCRDKPRPPKPSQPAEKNGRALHAPYRNIRDSAPDAHSQKSPADRVLPPSAEAWPSARQTSAPRTMRPRRRPVRPAALPPPPACLSAMGQTIPRRRRRRRPYRRERWCGVRCSLECRMSAQSVPREHSGPAPGLRVRRVPADR